MLIAAAIGLLWEALRKPGPLSDAATRRLDVVRSMEWNLTDAED